MADIFATVLGGSAPIILLVIIGVIAIVFFKILSIIMKARAAQREAWRYKQEMRIAMEEEREESEEPRKMAEERVEVVLAREETTLTQRKQLLIQQLSKSLRMGAASSFPAMAALNQLTNQQLRLFQKDIILERAGRVEERRKFKKLKRMDKLKRLLTKGEVKETIKKGKILRVIAKNKWYQLSNFTRQKVGFEQKERAAIMAEERLTKDEKKKFAKSINLIRNLIGILRNEIKTDRELEKAFRNRATIVKLRSLSRKMYSLFTKEIKELRLLLVDQNIKRSLAIREDALSKELYSIAKTEKYEENVEARLMIPIEKAVKG